MKEDKCGLWHRWLLLMALLTTVLAVHADESERLFKVFDSADGLASSILSDILISITDRHSSISTPCSRTSTNCQIIQDTPICILTSNTTCG